MVKVLASICVSELNRPRFESCSGHYSAIRLDRLSQGLPGLHPLKQGRTLGSASDPGNAI